MAKTMSPQVLALLCFANTCTVNITQAQVSQAAPPANKVQTMILPMMPLRLYHLLSETDGKCVL